MNDYSTIDLRLVGPPPERHAARVVAEMAQWLVGERSRLTNEIMSAALQSIAGDLC